MTVKGLVRLVKAYGWRKWIIKVNLLVIIKRRRIKKIVNWKRIKGFLRKIKIIGRGTRNVKKG